MAHREHLGGVACVCVCVCVHCCLRAEAPRYNQDTYFGRFRNFLTITSPVTLLKSQKDLDEAITLLQSYKLGQANDVDEERLWKVCGTFPATAEKGSRTHARTLSTSDFNHTRRYKVH